MTSLKSVMMITRNPNQNTNQDDSGDNTQMRYHYQNAYAVLEAVRLLDPNSLYSELYCEQEEDILLKRKDGKFTGVQVKTKEVPCFTLANKNIQSALEKFIVHEQMYPDKFSEYIIVTNCGVKGNLDDYISQLTITTGANIQTVSRVAQKVQFRAWASLRDYEAALVDQIATLINAMHHRLDNLKKLTNELLDVALNASRQTVTSGHSIYYLWLVDSQASISEGTIRGKMINPEMVREIVNKWLTTTGTLRGTDPITLCDLPHGLNRMELKMAKGGISCENIGLMRDLDNSTFKLLSEWGYTYGKKTTDERIEDLRLIVQHECQTAFDSSNNIGATFGKEMLIDVRKRLENRENDVKQKYFDFSFEHLEGLAGKFLQKSVKFGGANILT